VDLQTYAALDATAVAELVRERQVSVDEVHAAALAAVERVNPSINAVIEVLDPPRRARVDNGPTGVFAGVPFLIKDVGASLSGVRSELSSRLARGMTADADSEVLLRFLTAGMQAVGRSTASEFALLTTTETAYHGNTCTPWSVRHIASGSSGGSAAAVGAGIVPIAHGNDGGGSIRLPAACCGIVGLKPSRGRVTNQPVIGDMAFGWAGEFALTKSVRDTATLLDAVSGPAVGDPYVIARPSRPFLETLDAGVPALRVGIWSQPWSGVPSRVELDVAVRAVAHALEQSGAVIEEATPRFDWDQFTSAELAIFAPLHTAAVAEIAASTGRHPGPDTMEPHSLAVLREGSRRDAGDLIRGMADANAVALDIGRFFQDYDLLVTPTLPLAPDRLGVLQGRIEDGPDEIIALWSRHAVYTAPFNLTGNPAISLPLAQEPDGLPLGIQLVGRLGAEESLLRCAAHLERVMPWAERRPPVHAAVSDADLAIAAA
jgi:amidase